MVTNLGKSTNRTQNQRAFLEIKIGHSAECPFLKNLPNIILEICYHKKKRDIFNLF
jgi:hypothetical protein